MRVNNGSDGIGRVVEPVDKLEAERDQQRGPEQKKGVDGRRFDD
jgi:hypothetical protein